MLSQFKHQTTLHGGIVTIVMWVEGQWHSPSLSFGWIEHEGNDVTEILHPNDVDALVMEAEASFHDCGSEFIPERDAHRLGD